MRSTDKDIGRKKTNHSAVPMKWSMLKFLSAFLLSALILACSHTAPQVRKETAQTTPVPESERNLQKKQRLKKGRLPLPKSPLQVNPESNSGLSSQG